MRTKNTIKNSIYAISSYGMICIISLFIRKLFVEYISLEYLGLEGLFSNMFALFALADMGIYDIIMYRLYSSVANNDTQRINKLVSLYGYIYKMVGIAITVIGTVMIPMLKFIVKTKVISFKMICLIYCLQLLSCVSGYFLAYKRVIFIVYQKEYECVRVDTMCTFISNLIKCIVIVVFKNYLIYLFINIANNIISNIIVSIKSDKEYHLTKNNKAVKFRDIKKENIFHDVKNNISQKISATIYGGTDNILISAFLGINQVAMVSNYLLISNNITTIINKLLNPLQSSIGNLIYSEKKDRGIKLFKMFNMVEFMMASFISIAYIILFDDFIELWLGKEYIIDRRYIIFFGINQYIMWNHKILTYYRNSFGKFEIDKNYIKSAAVINVVVSIILINKMGVGGVMLGTAIGHMGFWIGRYKVVKSEYLAEKENGYVYIQLRNLVVFILELLLCIYLCGKISHSLIGIITKMFVCIVIPNVINILLYSGSEEIELSKEYLSKIVALIKKRGKDD